jgi:hypothetical protein
MKKHLLIIIAAVLFAGCAKKGNLSPAPITLKPTLIAKWYLTTDTVTDYKNGVQTQQKVYADDHTEYIQFNSDGSGVEGIDKGNSLLSIITFTYTFSSSSGELILNYPTQTVNGASQAAYSEPGTVKSLGANKLVLYFQSIQISGSNTYIADEVVYLVKP